ncbi:MAG: preprotein translocase subunit SecE [Bacteroidia bacterium]|nr:preprotein translocase subunit SecE [Bacteroidia bacterium]
MAKFREYIDEVGNELIHKVSWPTWKELQESSMIVLVSSIIIALLVLAMDLGTGAFMDLLYSLFN